MADFDEDDVLERLAGNAAAAAAAGVAGGPGDELDEADMSVSYLRMGTRENEAICVCMGERAQIMFSTTDREHEQTRYRTRRERATILPSL